MRKVQFRAGFARDFDKSHGTIVKLGEGGECALFFSEGSWHAVGSLCPHQNASLEGAEISEGSIICKRHGYRFDPKTGDCLTIGGYGLPTFPVQEADGELVVSVWEYDE